MMFTSRTRILAALRSFAGVGTNSTGHVEKWVSGAGGLMGIIGVILVSQAYLGVSGSASLVASMGASAVLLFAVPHGPLSQPWAVFGGHLVSAAIGVACARLHAPPFITSALAVALAISAMYYLRCIHPPGGATALTAVAGGDAVHALGFHYVLTPVLLNVLIILSVAILFNLPFPWRRYPAVWGRKYHPRTASAADTPGNALFSRKDLITASGNIDPRQSPGAGEFETTCSPALCNADTATISPACIRAGGYYCNGAFGPHWQVRRVMEIMDRAVAGSSDRQTVCYRVVAGHRRRQTGIAARAAFADWARYEVCLNENSWQRVDSSSACRTAPGDAA
jgi:hypothetical protein